MDLKEELADVCADLCAMLLEKNAKYGDSALNPCRVFSKASTDEQLRVRMDDKLSRLKNTPIEDDDEDVVMDLAGYLLLYLVQRNRLHNAEAAAKDAVDRMRPDAPAPAVTGQSQRELRPWDGEYRPRDLRPLPEDLPVNAPEGAYAINKMLLNDAQVHNASTDALWHALKNIDINESYPAAASIELELKRRGAWGVPKTPAELRARMYAFKDVDTQKDYIGHLMLTGEKTMYKNWSDELVKYVHDQLCEHDMDITPCFHRIYLERCGMQHIVEDATNDYFKITAYENDDGMPKIRPSFKDDSYADLSAKLVKAHKEKDYYMVLCISDELKRRGYASNGGCGFDEASVLPTT